MGFRSKFSPPPPSSVSVSVSVSNFIFFLLCIVLFQKSNAQTARTDPSEGLSLVYNCLDWIDCELLMCYHH
ncbi:hypothetical protein OSB04_010840 [Centaurea solstitialis]|uniref:Transmembrane protein n=1 Tax=Centaurea solstitialis TaxID=347529 RepID=A0AA38TJ22_9ASTR|nr:hypothetical protein OSB04_010840 [Centaurea solstitialis]